MAQGPQDPKKKRPAVPLTPAPTPSLDELAKEYGVGADSGDTPDLDALAKSYGVDPGGDVDLRTPDEKRRDAATKAPPAAPRESTATKAPLKPIRLKPVVVSTPEAPIEPPALAPREATSARPRPPKRAPKRDEPGTVSWGEADTEPNVVGSIKDGVRDAIVSTTKGAVGLGEAAVGIGSAATLGRVGKLAEAAGFTPKQWKERLDKDYSPGHKEAKAEFEHAEGLVGKAKAVAQNPELAAQSAIESGLPMLGGAAVARGLVKGGMSALTAGAIGEGVVGMGGAAEETRQATPGGLLTPKQAGLAMTSGAATAGLGRAGGWLARKVGIADIDAVLAGGPQNEAAQRGLAKQIVLAAAQEGALEELPQSVQEQVQQNVAQGKPWHLGLDAAAVLGFASGALMGGSMQVAGAMGDAGGPGVAIATPSPAPAMATPPAAAAPAMSQNPTGRDTAAAAVVPVAPTAVTLTGPIAGDGGVFVRGGAVPEGATTFDTSAAKLGDVADLLADAAQNAGDPALLPVLEQLIDQADALDMAAIAPVRAAFVEAGKRLGLDGVELPSGEVFVWNVRALAQKTAGALDDAGWPLPLPDAVEQVGDQAWEVAHEEVVIDLAQKANEYLAVLDYLARGVDPRTNKPFTATKTGEAQQKALAEAAVQLPARFDETLQSYRDWFGDEGVAVLLAKAALPEALTPELAAQVEPEQQQPDAEPAAPAPAPTSDGVAAPSASAQAEAPAPEPFDLAKFDAERDERIAASRAAGNTHLDELPAYVETMRGRRITYVHDAGETGRIATVDNEKRVFVDWDGGPHAGESTFLTQRDMKDYIAGAVEPAKKKGKKPSRVEQLKAAKKKGKQKDVAGAIVPDVAGLIADASESLASGEPEAAPPRDEDVEAEERAAERARDDKAGVTRIEQLRAAAARKERDGAPAAADDVAIPADLDTEEIRAMEREAESLPPTHLIDTPERNDWRDQEIEAMAQFTLEESIAHIVLGLPGSGKSTTTDPLRNTGAAFLDADIAKEHAGEYHGGLGATALHVESSNIRQAALERVVARGGAFIYPTIGHPENTRAFVEKLVTQGYAVHVHLIDVPPAVAARRVIAGVKDGTRHFVAPRYILKSADAPRRAYAALTTLDGVIAHDPLDNDFPKGTPARPVPDWQARWALPGAGPKPELAGARRGLGRGRGRGAGPDAPADARAHDDAVADAARPHEAARNASGDLRKSLARVKTAGLLDELLALEAKRVEYEANAVYEVKEDPNFHTGGIPQVVSTKQKGRKGLSLQAQYGQLLKGLNRVVDRIAAELATRMPAGDVWHALDDHRARRDEQSGQAGDFDYAAALRDTITDDSGNVLFEPDAPEYGGSHRPPGPGEGVPLHDLTGNTTGDVSGYPDDLYGPNGQQYYGSGYHDAEGRARDAEAFRVIHAARGKPGALVTIYRAVPHEPTAAERIEQLERQKAYYLKHGKPPKDADTDLSPKGFYDAISAELEHLKATPAEGERPALTINAGDWVATTRAYAKEHGESNLRGRYRILTKRARADELWSEANSIQEYGYWPKGSAVREPGGDYDLFGAPVDPEPAQESLFGEQAGTEKARSLKETEAAARAELSKLEQEWAMLKQGAPNRWGRVASMREEAMRANRRAKIAPRMAELQKLVNRDRKIGADELRVRAAGEQSSLLEPRPDGWDSARDSENVTAAFGSPTKAGLAATALMREAPAIAKLRAKGLPVSADRMKAVKLADRRAWVDLRGVQVTTPQKAADIMHAFRSPRMERLSVLLMDADDRILSHEMITSGALGYVRIEDVEGEFVEQIVARAKRVGAVRAILNHNHPSGDPTPSSDDRTMTVIVGDGLQAAGIHLVGHVVSDHGTATWIKPTIDPLTRRQYVDQETVYLSSSRANLPDWTDTTSHKVRGPQKVAELLADVLNDDTAAFAVLYLDSQHRVVGVAPHRNRSATTLGEWLPAQMRAHAARTVIIGARRGRTADTVGRIVAEAQRPGADFDAWGRNVLDVLALTDDPTRFTSGAEVGSIVSDPHGGEMKGPRRVKEAESPYPAPAPDDAPAEPVWYSKLERAIRRAPFDKGTVKQWKAVVSKGVNQMEVKWRRLDDVLPADYTGTVTRRQLLDHLGLNPVALERTTLDNVPRPLALEWEDKGATGWVVTRAGAKGPAYLLHPTDATGYKVTSTIYGETSFHRSFEAAKEYVEDHNRQHTTMRSAKFPTYTEEGGEQYREELVHAPVHQSTYTELPKDARAIRLQDGQWWVSNEDGDDLTIDPQPTKAEAIALALEHINYGRFLRRYPLDHRAFTQAHFPTVKNLIAHRRINERPLRGGGRTLHIEELQSDVNQKGLKAGYEGERKLPKGWTLTEASDFDLVGPVTRYDLRDDKGGNKGRYKTRDEALDRVRDMWGYNSVPVLPLHKTDDWLGNLLRTTIAEAVGQGFDAVTWTPGEAQADRYSLAKVVDKLQYDPDSGWLLARKDGAVVHSGKYDARALPDVIGKEAADKLLASERTPAADGFAWAQGTTAHTLEGEGLKVGGHGMIGFYGRRNAPDKSVVAAQLKKIGKELGVDIRLEQFKTGPKPASAATPSHWTDEALQAVVDHVEANMPSFHVDPDGGPEPDFSLEFRRVLADLYGYNEADTERVMRYRDGEDEGEPEPARWVYVMGGGNVRPGRDGVQEVLDSLTDRMTDATAERELRGRHRAIEQVRDGLAEGRTFEEAMDRLSAADHARVVEELGIVLETPEAAAAPARRARWRDEEGNPPSRNFLEDLIEARREELEVPGPFADRARRVLGGLELLVERLNAGVGFEDAMASLTPEARGRVAHEMGIALEPVPDEPPPQEVKRTFPGFRITPDLKAAVTDPEKGLAVYERPPEGGYDPAGETGPTPEQIFSPAGPGTPLAARVATAKGQPPATAAQAAQVKSLATIARTLAAMVDVPLRQGRFLAGARRARGVFFPDKEVTRVLRFDQLDTAAHEVGHYVSMKYLRNPTMKKGLAAGAVPLSTAMKRELVKMGKDLYGSRKPNGGYGEEGIAQWANFYVTDPARLATDAPLFSAWVESTVLAVEPTLRRALAQARSDFADYKKAPATARVDAMIDVKPERRLWPSTRFLATQLIDDLSEIRRAVEQLGTSVDPSENAYILARLTRGGAGMADAMIRGGVIDPDTGKPVTKGVAEVLKQLKPEDVQPFRRYLVAERTLEVAARGVDSGISTADAKDVVKLYEAKFRPLAEELWAISNALIDYRQKKGLLTQLEAATIKKANARRVGFYRVFDDDEKAAGQGGAGRGFGRNSSGLQAIKGSARTIIDPLESVITDIYKTVQQSHAAEVLAALVKHADSTQGGGRVVEVLTEAPKRAVEVSVEDVKQQLAALGFVLDPAAPLLDPAAVLRSFENVSQPGPKEAKDLVRALVINGKRKWVQIADAPLYDALLGLGTPVLPPILRWLSIPTRTLRAGATLTLEFLARNPVRDAFSAAVYSRGPTRPPGWDFAKGLFHVMRDDQLYREWQRDGGDNAAMLGLDRVDIHQHVGQLLRSKEREALDWVLKPIDRLRMVSSLFENATRVGEYATVREEMRRRGAAERDERAAGAIASRDVTIDFARAGHSTRIANQLVAFINSNVQGWDKLARELKHRPKTVVPRLAAFITLPSILLYLLQKDDPAYQEVPRWQKTLAWVIVQRGKPVPLPAGREPTAEDRYAAEHGAVEHIWRIPKPPDIGVLFGSFPEQALDYAYRKDPRALKEIGRQLFSMQPLHMPESLAPIVEWMANYNFFTGRPTVPEGIAKLPAGEQATSRTGEAARQLGKWAPVSPAKVEKAVSSTFGGLGSYGMGAANTAVRAGRELAGTHPLPRPAARKGDAMAHLPLLKGFMVRVPELDAQSVQDALDEFAKADGHRQTWRRRLSSGDVDGGRRYFKKHEADIRSVATPTDGLGRPGYLYDARELILDAQRTSRDAPDEERARIADVAIRAARSALAGERIGRMDRMRLGTAARRLDAKMKRLQVRSRIESKAEQ